MKKVHLLIIDPQEDFCHPNGALFVGGANADSIRLSDFINKFSDKIVQIHVTLDSHRSIHIAHPIFWMDKNGKHPDFYTIISEKDVEDGIWRTTNPAWQQRGLEYVKELTKNKRYPLRIWPPHCIIGTWGHSVVKSVSDALIAWENRVFGVVNYIAKGSNIFTENYSAYKADVPDPHDQSTMPNVGLLNSLKKADEILVGGEALSHCLASTVRDLASDIGPDNIKKLVLLRDTTSNVYQCEKLGEDFINELTARGMRSTTTAEYVV